MPIFETTVQTNLDGRNASEQFGSSFKFFSSVAAGSQAIFEWQRLLADIYLPILVNRIELYSITVSPVVVPGTRKKTRNDHVTHYIEDRGTHVLAAGVDPAILNVCAEFVKYSTAGTAGTMQLRGVMSEDELKSNIGGAPVNSNALRADPANLRFRTFATSLFQHVGTLPGGRLILPGPSRKPNGDIPTLGEWEGSARTVAKVQFDRFTVRSLQRANKSIESKVTALLRSMINRLRSAYNNALQDSDFNAGAIPPTTLATLRELGHDIFVRFSASERLRVKVEPVIKAFIV
jgi:uncharacterized ParB-like nuclease family protein